MLLARNIVCAPSTHLAAHFTSTMGDAEKSSFPRGQDLAVRAAILGVALLAAGVVFWLRFCGEVDRPARPAAPSVTEPPPDRVTGTPQGGDLLDRQRIADARSLRLQRIPGAEEMARGFPHQQSTARQRLEVGQSIEAAGLRIAAVVVNGVMALRIENLAAAPVAYRVDAQADRGRACRGASLRHDALALGAKGSANAVAVRGLCPARSESGVTLGRVETVQLPALGFHYVSRMRPAQLGLDEEQVRGHRPGTELAGCEPAAPAWLEGDIESGRTTWRDLVDFYARHPCDKYAFTQGYKAIEQDAQPLP